MQNNEQRTQRILEHLEQQLRRPHEPSHENFKAIVECVLNLPEAYKGIGLMTIADHFVNGMEMHLLDLVAIFERNAAQEGIPEHEYQITLQDVLPKVAQTLSVLRKQLCITSLDELAALNNITIRLYTLSSSDTAAEAEQWLYEIPTTYLRQLGQANLLQNERHNDQEASDSPATPPTHFTKWQSFYPAKASKPIPDADVMRVISTVAA